MTTETVEYDNIGPELSLSDVAFPSELGERFQTLYGTEKPPADGAAWVEQMREAITAVRDRQPTVDDLCTVADGEHVFTPAGGGDEQRYICVLDPLAYPFLTGETGTVRSTTPVREATVAFEITADGVDVSHDEAVVSLGVSDHVEEFEDAPVETVYRQVCGYIQTFEDREEYETWAADVDAATVPLSAAEGVAVAREIAVSLFTGEDRAAT